MFWCWAAHGCFWLRAAHGCFDVMGVACMFWWWARHACCDRSVHQPSQTCADVPLSAAELLCMCLSYMSSSMTASRACEGYMRTLSFGVVCRWTGLPCLCASSSTCSAPTPPPRVKTRWTWSAMWSSRGTSGGELVGIVVSMLQYVRACFGSRNITKQASN